MRGTPRNGTRRDSRYRHGRSSTFPCFLLVRACCACVWLSTSTGPTAGPLPCLVTNGLRLAIAVEKVRHGMSGEATGLREGDVLLSWSDGVSGSLFTTATELTRVAYEQAATLRRLVIHGWRGRDKRVWQLSRPGWGLECALISYSAFYSPILKQRIWRQRAKPDKQPGGSSGRGGNREWQHQGLDTARPWLS